MNGFEENAVIDEGMSRAGVHTQLSFEGDELIIKKSFDARPHLEYAERARQSTDGKRWGEGRLMGHIPPVFYAQILVITDPQERAKAIKTFFADNPAFVMFDRALRFNAMAALTRWTTSPLSR